MRAHRKLPRRAPGHAPRRVRGLTLIELLVGLTISSLIIVGTVFVYSQSRTTYALNDRAARLQEYGRFALSVLEPDLQLAGYYGFSNNSSDLRYMNGAQEIPTSQLEPKDDAIKGLPGAVHTCGNNFALDLITTVQGTENAYLTNASDCKPPKDYKWQPGSDTLTIRRASTAAVTATKTKLQLYVNELKRSNQFIFNNDTAPGPIDARREVHDLVLHSYYVSNRSDGSDSTPSLRRKVLATDGTDPSIVDEEVLPGVEDMQVQFGIDTGDHDTTAGIDVDEDKNGIPDNPNGLVSRYVNADDALLMKPADGGVQAQVVAVRIWLRIRADDREPGFIDTRNYTYAGIDYTPAGADAGYRRIVISRTIFLRNARTL
jgi:type IV pilus assembly protein PilW